MRVLVTGGSGVVGEAAVRALLRRGHQVRLLARHAEDDARDWPRDVEPWRGDVTQPDTLRGAGDGCDAVLHCVGIVDEDAPRLTFQAVNVDGTRHVVDEAARAGVPHLVYVSSLGADRGESPYHRSKLAGEAEARRFAGRAVIVRPGNVYGPGDEVVSRLLKMVRSLPAIPVIAGGEQPFQPVWADDVGEALTTACERADLAGRALDVAGPERTTMQDLLDRFAALTGRDPVRLPMPGFVASLGVKLAGAVGMTLPINESQLIMLSEENVIARAEDNALDTVLGVTPTPLDAGLRRLLDSLPEQLPDEGVGALRRKRFWADVQGTALDAPAMFARFARRFQQVTPSQVDLEAEPGTPTAVLTQGQTVTMAIPLRGTVQVRVAELTDTSVTLQTVQGHALAGAIRFAFAAHGSATPAPADAPAPAHAGTHAWRFEVDLLDRAGSTLDWLAMHTFGDRMQDATWHELVGTVVTEAGGEAPAGVQHEQATLEGEEAERVERWLTELAHARKRASNAAAVDDGATGAPMERDAG